MATLAPNGTAGNTTTATIAASYERVSTLLQGKYGFSLAAQEKDAHQYCRERGWALPDDLVFKDGEDRNASGKDWDLPGLNAMLDAAKAGRFSALVVPNTSRFARDVVKARVLEQQLRGLGVRVIYLNIPVEEETKESRLLKHQLQDFDEYHREVIAFNTYKGRREKAEQGLYVGSEPCPYGYRYVYSPGRGGKPRVTGIEADPTTSAIVKRIFALVVAMPMLRALRVLKQEGYRSPRGLDHWSYGTIRQIVRNPVYRGMKTWGRKLLTDKDGSTTTKKGNPRRGDYLTGIEIPCAALVDVATWDKANAALDARREYGLRMARTRNDFDLRGRLFCSNCDRLLVCKSNRGRRFYQCGCHWDVDAEKRAAARCELPRMDGAEAEAHVKKLITDLFLDRERLERLVRAAQGKHDAADADRRERLEIIGKEITLRRKRLDRISVELLDVDEGSEAHASLKRTQATTDKELDKLKAEQRTLESAPATGLSPEQALTLLEAADRVRANLERATPETLQEIYALLELRGIVRRDDERGVPLGKYRFVIDWTANGLSVPPDRICL